MSGWPLSIGPQTGYISIPHLSSTSGFGLGVGRKNHHRPSPNLHTRSSYVDITTAQSFPRLRRSESVGGLHHLRNTMGLQFGSRGRKELVRTNSSAMPPAIPDPHSPLKKRSMTATFASLSSSPRCSDELPVIDICKKHASDDELDACNNFVPKKIWAKRCNMKLHPYHEQVAYMQAYDPVSLESDRYTDLLFQRLTKGSPSFHDYGSKPPAMVLDLGCGQGHWILHAANLWTDTEFVGLDIVDITLPAFELAENIRLVQGDFLNYKLPFSDDTFDFVRMANLSLCIPHEQWEFVLSQVHRVLTPGGRLELIDDDIYFPYGEEWKEVETASLRSGTFFGDERLGAGIINQDKDENEDEETNGADPEALIVDGTADSSTTTSDSPSKPSNVCLVRSRTHYVLKRKATLSQTPPRDPLSEALRTPEPATCHERSLLKLISPRSPTPGAESKTSSRSVTPRIGVPPSSTTGNSGKSSPPCPKRIREKVALLPPIRSITPTFSPSSASRYSPTWSVRTSDASPTSSIRTTDTSPTASIHSIIHIVNPKKSVWQRTVAASKNMESLFEKMLVQQYGIHPRPAEFMLQVLGTVFRDRDDAAGETRVGMKSFHIKLAPTATIDQSNDNRKGTGRSSMDEVDDITSGTSSIVPETQNGTLAMTISLAQAQDKESKGSKGTLPKDKDKKQSQLEERFARQKKTQGATMSSPLFKKSVLQDSALSSPVVPTLSAKAAVILGIPYSELSAVTSSLSDRRPSSPRACSPYMSAKAAGRLGIPYSEALSAAALFSFPHNAGHLTESPPPSPSDSASSLSTSNTTSGSVQHPGLLIWPDTYIPMAAGELEMHACKYIHTLLGCRPALEEFVAKFVDERGERFISEEEFTDEIWEYECFRRSRFNWPSEVPEPYEDDPVSPNATKPLPCTASNSSGTGGAVDTNHTTTIADLPAVNMSGSVSMNGSLQILSSTTTTHQARATELGGFLRPTQTSLTLRSSSIRQQRSPSMPMKGKFKSQSPSPVPSTPRRDSSGCNSITEGSRSLADLVHLRSIRVFEGIKAA